MTFDAGRQYERDRICEILRARMDQLPRGSIAWQEALNLYRILTTHGTEQNPT